MTNFAIKIRAKNFSFYIWTLCRWICSNKFYLKKSMIIQYYTSYEMRAWLTPVLHLPAYQLADWALSMKAHFWIRIIYFISLNKRASKLTQKVTNIQSKSWSEKAIFKVMIMLMIYSVKECVLIFCITIMIGSKRLTFLNIDIKAKKIGIIYLNKV